MKTKIAIVSLSLSMRGKNRDLPLRERESLRLSEVRERDSLSYLQHMRERVRAVLQVSKSLCLSKREGAKETARETCPLCL